MKENKLLDSIMIELTNFYIETPKVLGRKYPKNKHLWNKALCRAAKRIWFLFLEERKVTK